MDTNKGLPNNTPRTALLLGAAPSSDEVKVKELSVEDRTKPYTDRAIEVIVGIMNDEKCGNRTRLDAANLLLDRSWGKSTVKHEAPVVVTLQDTLRALEEKDKRYKQAINAEEVIDVTEEVDWGDSI